MSCCSGPVYFIEKAFVLFVLKVNFTALNPLHQFYLYFIHNIQNISLNNSTILASLAVVSLYPPIDTVGVTQVMNQEIDKQSHLSNNIKTSLKSGLNLIRHSNVFFFDKIFYRQDIGVPMGVFNFWFIDGVQAVPLEEKIFKNIHPRSNIWLRYVDGIFFTWNFGRQPLLDFLSEINEIDNGINLLIKNSNTLKCKLHRKPVKIDSVIPFNSTAS